MNIAAVILLFVGLLLALASLVVLGLPSLVTSSGHIYAMYKNGFSDIFGGLKNNFANFFNIKLMFEASYAKNELIFFFIFMGVIGVGALMLLAHFILLIIHRKGRAIGPGLLWIVVTAVTSVLIVIFLIPVPMGRTFVLADGTTPSTEWVSVSEQGDFMSIIAAIKAENNGWASGAPANVQTLLLLPFYFACAGYGLGLIGFLLSFLDACRKKKPAKDLLGPNAQPAAATVPVQIIPQNAPSKDRIIIVPVQEMAPQQKAGPHMVQYINTPDEEEETDQYATEDDVREAIRQQLNGEVPDPVRDPDPEISVPEVQVPPASQYMTKEEARESVRDALTSKKAK